MMKSTKVNKWFNQTWQKIKYPEYKKGCDIMYFLLKYFSKNVIGIIIDFNLGHGAICITESQPEKCFVCTGHTLECNQLRKNRECLYCLMADCSGIKLCDACPLIKIIIWIENDRTVFGHQIIEYFRKDCPICIKRKNVLESLSDAFENDFYFSIDEYIEYKNKSTALARRSTALARQSTDKL
jgi:hypothetical protein